MQGYECQLLKSLPPQVLRAALVNNIESCWDDLTASSSARWFQNSRKIEPHPSGWYNPSFL